MCLRILVANDYKMAWLNDHLTRSTAAGAECTLELLEADDVALVVVLEPVLNVENSPILTIKSGRNIVECFL
jgi:hypothetical protein